MRRLNAEVTIIGSGFAGSLLALILRRQGLDVVLLDREHHPRFAIGESATPAADLVLEDLCRRYDLPRLAPLARYGSWRERYPHLRCGPKRGFSYFHHEPGQPFVPRDDHANELLVTSSAADAVADTHWYRADIDAFLAGEAVLGGAQLVEAFQITGVERQKGWQVQGTQAEEPTEIRSQFVVDGSGAGSVLPRALGLPSASSEMLTNSWAVYGHFRAVPRWRSQLRAWGGGVDDHPFDCDAAALHHILDGAWVWVLPFAGDITSVGLVADGRRHPLSAKAPVEGVWRDVLSRYPALGAQFESAELVPPFTALRGSGRIQRHWRFRGAKDWTLLPGTAGFVDPFYSTGIAHSMVGVERVARAFDDRRNVRRFERELDGHAQTTAAELTLIDRLVAGAYRTFGADPRMLHGATMLYFAAATTWERERSDDASPRAFLLADDEDWIGRVDRCLTALGAASEAGPEGVAMLTRTVAREIAPYNTVGLCDPGAQNLYRYTAAPIA